MTVVFDYYEKLKNKMPLNQKSYLSLCNEIIAHFDLIAPYYKFCGNQNMQVEKIVEGYKTEYRQRAKILIKEKKIFKEEWVTLHNEFLQKFYR